MASKAGVRVSSVGSNLLYLNQECTEAKSYFKHISEYETSGHGYAASAADMSTKASKRISKILGGAGSILSFGGNTLSSVGHSMQQLHPNAQTGASARSSITEMITIESIQHAEDAIQQWVDSKQKFIAEVPCHMETKLAEEIMMLFKEAGALVLVENSTILRDKASRVLDDASEWELM
jgi:predicted ATP-binding protein involved in virulence